MPAYRAMPVNVVDGAGVIIWPPPAGYSPVGGNVYPAIPVNVVDGSGNIILPAGWTGPMGSVAGTLGGWKTYWNSHAQSSDVAFIFAGQQSIILPGFAAGQYVIGVPYPLPGPFPTALLAQALLDGAPGGIIAQGGIYCSFGDESSLVYATLLAHLQTAVNQIHLAGQLCLWGPTWNAIDQLLPGHPDLITTTDAIILQSQQHQDDPSYISEVQNQVAKIRAASPGIPIVIQLQVTRPNSNPVYVYPTAQMVGWIDQIGALCHPAWISLYYFLPNLSDMEAVFTHYRP